ncbi:MAG: MGDG synthase family glycosyltransferase [Anaerolineae bacterium]
MSLPPRRHNNNGLVRFLFLASWTGGGHFAAARAVAATLAELEPAACCTIVDVLRDYCPFPFSRFPDAYSSLATRYAWLWHWLWRQTDHPVLADTLTSLAWPLLARRLRAMLHQYQPNALISVHPLLVRPAIRLARQGLCLPVACIATDMICLHAFWLATGADLYFVPTEEAAASARLRGIPTERLVISGQPIKPADRSLPSHHMAKAALGLRPDLPLVLLAAGGAGMGPLEQCAIALEQCRSPLQLAVICGHNQNLRLRLRNRAWNVPTKVLGFVDNMPYWLRAADVLVTKAGPGTLAEAMAEGLPIVIMDALPGQETDNVRFLCHRQAAIWAPQPQQLAIIVADLLAHPDKAKALADHARQCAKPDAAHMIAGRLLNLVHT